MGRSAPPMRFAGGPPRQSFASRPGMMARPAFGPQRRSVVTFGHVNHGHVFFTPGFSHHFDHFHNRRFVFVTPYYYGGYYPPYYGDYGYPYYSSFGTSSYDQTNNGYADLSNQMNQISSELQQLRYENDSLRSSLDEQRRPAPPAVSTAPKPADEPATVIVYRDGRRAEVQSYAIVGSTLWLLSSTRASKVPLSDVDLDKTAKDNADRGVEFLIPK